MAVRPPGITGYSPLSVRKPLSLYSPRKVYKPPKVYDPRVKGSVPMRYQKEADEKIELEELARVAVEERERLLLSTRKGLDREVTTVDSGDDSGVPGGDSDALPFGRFTMVHEPKPVQSFKLQGEPVFQDEEDFERYSVEAAGIASRRAGPLNDLPSRPLASPAVRSRRVAARAAHLASLEEPTASTGLQFGQDRFGGTFQQAFDEAEAAGLKEFTYIGSQKDRYGKRFKVERKGEKFNVDTFTTKLVQRESSGRADVKNPRSTATGLHQFTVDTWMNIARKYHPELLEDNTQKQVLDLRKDPETSQMMFESLTDENRNILEQKGIPINYETMYAAHFAGASTAVKIYKARDYEPISRYFTAGAMRVNPHLRGMSVGDFKQWVEHSMKDRANA